MSLPIAAAQLRALRALQRANPALGELASAVALAFDTSRIDNPQLARLILERTCRRIVTGQEGSHEVLVRHLEHFGALGCLSVAQVTDFPVRIRSIARDCEMMIAKGEG